VIPDLLPFMLVAHAEVAHAEVVAHAGELQWSEMSSTVKDTRCERCAQQSGASACASCGSASVGAVRLQSQHESCALLLKLGSVHGLVRNRASSGQGQCSEMSRLRASALGDSAVADPGTLGSGRTSLRVSFVSCLAHLWQLQPNVGSAMETQVNLSKAVILRSAWPATDSTGIPADSALPQASLDG
jgi:hypothetical protein